MRRYAALLLLSLALCAGAAQALDLPEGLDYVPGEVLVRFHAQTPPEQRALALARAGGTLRAVGRDALQLELAPGESVDDAVAQLRLDAAVAHAQPNYVYRPQGRVPNDPYFGDLWGLHNTGQVLNSGAVGTPGADLGMVEAWAYTTDCRAVVVAVVDTGVNYTHVDLAANMWDGSARGYAKHGFDFFDNDYDPMPADGDGHGTHVAATIGAVGNNGVGVSGVCWNAQIMAIRAMNRRGGTTATLIQAVEFAVANGAHIINMSLGGGSRDALFEDALRRARDAGVAVVAAAGNAGNDNDQAPFYPCSYALDNMLCVAALEADFSRASFSNYGARSVHTAAPGRGVLSAWPGRITTIPLTDAQWTKTGRWAQPHCDFGGGRTAMLTNPENWCARGTYSRNANDVIYRTLNLAGYGGARLDLKAFVDLEAGYDYLQVARRAGGGNPFTGAGTVVATFSGRQARHVAQDVSVELGNCLTANCSVGFRLHSDARVQYEGVGLYAVMLHAAEPQSRSYRYASGTSMAAPHAAGVLALVWAYNPAFDYRDALAAVMAGGTSLPALREATVSGSAVSAIGSLRHIAAPTGLRATAP